MRPNSLVCSIVLFITFALMVSGSSCHAQSSETRPNIVLILSDDQAWTDYQFMGHECIQTPHLDRLAARSAVFRRGYTPTPLCRPSLMTIITGLYAHQHGVTGNDPKPNKSLTEAQYSQQKLDLISKVDSLSTIPKELSSLGYISMQSGKWWEGNFRRGGFTHGMTRGFPEQGGRHGDDGLTIGRQGMKPVIDFINTATSEKKPFFLWYAPMLPHTPHNPPERLLAKYQKEGRAPELAKYYAMCEWFDESCGQILTHLDQTGIADDTIVMYVTDNGWIQSTPDMKLPAAFNHGFAPRSKQTVYEGGIRTPIMVSWPGKIVPGDRSILATTLDVYPTLLSAVGVNVAKALPGRNLLPWITANAGSGDRDQLFGESFAHDIEDLNRPEASLQYRWTIQNKWKLIVSYDAPEDRYAFVHKVNEKAPQLFDLTADPFEKTNLALQNPELVKSLEADLQKEWTVSKRPIGFP
ncbi:MAG: sulfatase [Planctomycetaceae bacterium]|nr:sulfatase [Planctomycetaceae bacterium]